MLQKQVITVPLAKGLDTKTDPFQVEAGNSLVLENARFYKTGKLQKRFGLIGVPSVTTLNSPRAIISDGEMLNVLDADGIQAYSESSNDFSLISEMRDTVKISSDFISKSPFNHYNPDMDILQDDGLAVYCYREVEEYSGLTIAIKEYITVVTVDMATGLKKIKKISLGITTNPTKEQQKIAVIKDSGGNTYFHVFYDSTSLRVRYTVLDKNLEEVSTTTLETYASTSYKRHKMDVCKDAGFVYLCDMQGTTLKIRKYTPGGALSTSTTATTINTLGYDTVTDNGLGFSTHLSSGLIHVFFVTTDTGPGRKMAGIGFNTSIANTISETSSTDINRLIELSIVSSASSVFLATNSVDTTNKSVELKLTSLTWTTSYVFGVADYRSSFRSAMISRPFIKGSDVFIFAKCPELSTNTGLLVNLSDYKFSGMFSPISLSPDRMTNIYSAGIVTGTCNSVYYSNISYSAAEKSYALVSNNLSGYDFNANIAIASVSSDFSDNITCGTKTKLGETNYYTNGVTFCLDNRGAYEQGFFLPPTITSVAGIVSGPATPAIASKTFTYKAVYNFFNAKGELDRSIPSLGVAVTTLATATYITVKVKNLTSSFKSRIDSNFVEQYAASVVLYRTTNNGSSYYRVSSTSSSPSSETIEINDAMSDTDLVNNEILYTTGGVVENDPAPNAKFSTAGGNRLFLGGLEEEDEIAFSKKQLFGEAVAFSGNFRIRISSGTISDRSKLSALGFMDGKLIIFRENSIYYIAGDGPLETGAQDTFTNPEVISSDTGCIEPRSVLNLPDGLLFKSKKGIYLLGRSLQVSYVGSAVEDFNGEGIVSAIVSDKFNEARFYTDAGNCLVYNYLFESWSVYAGQSSVDANIWAATPVQILSGSIFKETESSFTDNAVPYAMRIKTPWLKLSGLQDFARIWSLTILGKYKSAHALKIKAYYDYDESAFDEYVVNPSVTDTQYQYRIHLKKQKCESVQFEIRDLDQTGESMELTAITLEVGLRKGAMKLPASRKY